MKLLLASVPTFNDSLAVGPVIDQIVQDAGGEVVTIVLTRTPVSDIARRIVAESLDAGLETEEWLGWTGYFGGLDGVFSWGSTNHSGWARLHRIPLMEFHDTLYEAALS